ncbi:hypothetical protein HQ585_11545 [candidate division KSB1 bacterium]|nr:hypothetical protein [candidate division KSB1 bacterium]
MKTNRITFPSILFIISLILCQQLSAGSFTSQIQADLDRGHISQADAVYYNAIGSLRPELIPERYIADVQDVEKCGSHTIQQVHHFWPEFSVTQQSHLEQFAYRPDLTESYVSSDGLFRVHYNIEGQQAVSPEDSDASGVPDYVERTAEYLMESYQVEIVEMGLPEPPPDDEESGPEWDVYLKNIPGYYGWIDRDRKVGVNPDIYTTFMTLDNDYVHTKTKGLEALRVTVAHEFLHMIQFGTVFRDEDLNGVCDDQFLNEAASTWMEDRVYDEVNDYLYYLPEFFEKTNRPFYTFDRSREYGLCVWFHFLDKRFQGMDIIRRILNEMIFYPAMEACDAALQDLGNSFADQLSLFYAWNMMTGTRADTLRFYPEGHLYPQISMDLYTPFSQDTLLSASVRATASRYYGFITDDSTLYTLIPTNTGVPVLESANCFLGLRKGNDRVDYTSLDAQMQASLFSDSDVLWQSVAIVIPQDEISRMVIVEPHHGTLTSSISGVIWEDADGDGYFDEGTEMGLYAVLLELIEAGEDGAFDTGDEVTFPSTESFLSGTYEFPTLYEGIYQITVDESTLPQGFLSTTGGFEREVVVLDSQEIEDVNFGFRELNWRPAAIPNPFIPAEHGQVRIPITLREPHTIRLIVYSLSGFQVYDREQYFTEGPQFFMWDGRDLNGEIVPSGVYLYVLESDYTLIRREKLVIVR